MPGVGDAGGTRSHVSAVSSPISVGSVPETLLLWRYLDDEGRSRGAPGVGDAAGTRRSVSAVSMPISVGIGPLISLP